jgi:hypothetical protein
MQNVNFLKIIFKGQVDFIVVWYSATNMVYQATTEFASKVMYTRSAAWESRWNVFAMITYLCIYGLSDNIVSSSHYLALNSRTFSEWWTGK